MKRTRRPGRVGLWDKLEARQNRQEDHQAVDHERRPDVERPGDDTTQGRSQQVPCATDTVHPGDLSPPPPEPRGVRDDHKPRQRPRLLRSPTDETQHQELLEGAGKGYPG